MAGCGCQRRRRLRHAALQGAPGGGQGGQRLFLQWHPGHPVVPRWPGAGQRRQRDKAPSLGRGGAVLILPLGNPHNYQAMVLSSSREGAGFQSKKGKHKLWPERVPDQRERRLSGNKWRLFKDARPAMLGNNPHSPGWQRSARAGKHQVSTSRKLLRLQESCF